MQRVPKFLMTSLLLSSVYASSAVAAATPLIVPQLLEVVAQKKCLQEDEQEYFAEILIDLESTGVDWLDQALLARLAITNPETESLPVDMSAQLQDIKQQANAWLVESYADIKEAREAAEPYFFASVSRHVR